MTIRLLATYKKFKPNTIVTLASAEETALVAGGNATTDLSGGKPFAYQLPANNRQNNVSYAPDGTPLGISDSTGKILSAFAGIAAPGAPTGLTLTAIAGGVLATMTAPTVTGGTAILGYEVTLSTGQVQLGETTTVTVNAPAGTAVTATAKAINGFDKSVASTVSNSVTPTGTVTPTAPGAPTVSATAGNASAVVTIAAGSGGAAASYTVVSSPAGGVDSHTGDTTSPRTITGLVNGTSYTFTATATNSVGTSAASAASAPVTPSAGVVTPGAPSLVATGGNTSASVAITQGSGGAPTGYTVTSSPAGGVDPSAGTLTTPRTITGLVNGTSYTFTGTATNSAGTSAASAPSNAVTPAAQVVAKSRAANSFAANSVAA